MAEQPLCVIDVGSNTARMLVGLARRNKVVRLCYRQHTTRLASGLSETGLLQPDRIAATVDAVRSLLSAAESFSPARTVVVATEAIRSASNGAEFARQLLALTGFTARVLNWETEARLACLGALHSLTEPADTTLFFDLGGGSLELVRALGTEIQKAVSLPVGVVRLSEGAVPPERMRAMLHQGLKDVAPGMKVERLVGTAGTVTTLAAVHLGMSVYQPGIIDGTILHRSDLLEIRQRLGPLSVAERESVPGMEPGRGDLILHGIDVVLALMELSGIEQFVVADGGLLEGVLLDATMFH